MEGKQKQMQAISRRGESVGLTKHSGSGIAAGGQNTGV